MAQAAWRRHRAAVDPVKRWERLIKDLERCLAKIPPKRTLDELPPAKRDYITMRFKRFGEELAAAVATDNPEAT